MDQPNPPVDRRFIETLRSHPAPMLETAAPPTAGSTLRPAGLLPPTPAAPLIPTTPWALLVLVPVVVLIAGLSLAWMSDRALMAQAHNLADEQVARTASVVEGHLTGILAQADPLIAALHVRVERGIAEANPEKQAAWFSALAIARPGLAYLSVSTPDGRFAGLRPEGQSWVLNRSSVGLDGSTPQTEDLLEGEALCRLRATPTSGYDPRVRPFYHSAVTLGTAVWSAPYAFFREGTTGISRSAPVSNEQGLQAVVTVDFDVSSLAKALTASLPQDWTAAVVDEAGVFIALPTHRRVASNAQSTGKVLTVADLADPLLVGLLHRGADLGVITAQNKEWLGATRRVTPVHGIAWRLAVAAPRELLLKSAEIQRRRTLWLGLVIVAVAVSGAVLLAMVLRRARRSVELAGNHAQAARDALRDLGAYHLMRLIGRGGMGEVWIAEHRLLARPTALKLIRSRDDTPQDRAAAEQAFLGEARITASLRSRHAVEIYDFGHGDNGLRYLAMELLDGIDLQTLVDRHGPQPWHRVALIIAQVCSALDEAHARGLVHRDIKPANLFCTRIADELDVAKVLDFGLAVAMSDPDASRPAGTIAFMAPEQALGTAVDGRADLYALGGVMFWLLTGRLPFTATTPSALLDALRHTPPSLPSMVCAIPFPAELDQLVHACLAKDPHQRPAGVLVVAECLRALRPTPEDTWTTQRCAAWWQAHVPRQA